MGAEPQELHVAFMPLTAPGHIIPTIDIVRMFISRKARTTILTTPRNAQSFTNSLGESSIIETLPFPTQDYGLPEGTENFEECTSVEMNIQLLQALQLLKEPLEQFLERTRPDCLVADEYFIFATDVAAKFGIPRLVFHGTSFFAVCAGDALKIYEPQKSVSSDDEPIVIPNLPHEIKFTKTQLFHVPKDDEPNKEAMYFFAAIKEAEAKSYGVLFNSFYELEPDYADYFRKEIGTRAWHIGPASLCNRLMEEKSQRGKKASIDVHECVKWLDSKEPNSVIYVCFGSMTRFSALQLREIAMSLEASGLHFVWVVRKSKEEDIGKEDWLPAGFEERVEGRGLVIRGWAPQVLILEHEAVGGFMTHCGWNSILESLSAGVPMVTWPVFAEQFVNEKLVTDVLKVGVQVGTKVWSPSMAEGEILKAETIEAALKRFKVGEEALEMRKRAKKLKEMAQEAVEEGGSSFCDLSALIDELKCHRP